jgi:hypothetical protein
MRPTRLRLALAAVAVLAAAPALAACDEPGWDLPALVAVLGRAAAVDTGAPLARDAGTAVTIDLAPQADVTFDLPPERPPRNTDPRAGVVRFAAGAAGSYVVALSDAAWIDIVQDGALVASGDFLGIHDCPGIRKVVAFDLSDAPFTLQLGDADVAAIAVALVPRR